MIKGNSVTETSIIKELIDNAPMSIFREHLEEMFLCFVLYHQCLDEKYKEDVVYAYRCLRNHIESIAVLEGTKYKSE